MLYRSLLSGLKAFLAGIITIFSRKGLIKHMVSGRICFLFWGFFFLSILTVAQTPDSSRAISNTEFHFSFWDSMPSHTGWINDFENLYTIEEEKILDSVISDFNKHTTIEIAIVTIDTMATPKSRFEELALYMANKWGVGAKEKNNGILIAISKVYRKMRIVNGWGIEKLISDQETKSIIDTFFIPYFKEERYFEGTLSGLQAIKNQLISNENILK